MAYIRSRRATAGGGGGTSLTSIYETFEITTPYTSGDLIGPLAHSPHNGQDGMIVWFQQNMSNPFDDWGFSGTTDFYFNFNFDPATDYPPTGTVTIVVWYQYVA